MRSFGGVYFGMKELDAKRKELSFRLTIVPPTSIHMKSEEIRSSKWFFAYSLRTTLFAHHVAPTIVVTSQMQ